MVVDIAPSSVSLRFLPRPLINDHLRDIEKLTISSIGRPPLRRSKGPSVVVLGHQLPRPGLHPVMAWNVCLPIGAICRTLPIVLLAVQDDHGVALKASGADGQSNHGCKGRDRYQNQQIPCQVEFAHHVLPPIRDVLNHYHQDCSSNPLLCL